MSILMIWSFPALSPEHPKASLNTSDSDDENRISMKKPKKSGEMEVKN
jgi:hypothetical protein